MRGISGRALASSQVSTWLTGTISVPARRQVKGLPLDTVNKQGVFHWLGTNWGATSWSNPAGSAVTLTAKTYDTQPIANSTARDNTDFYTTNTSGAWWKANLGSTHLLLPKYMSIRQRAASGSNLLQAFVLDGSQDDTYWTTLATVNNGDLTETQGAWNHIPLSPLGEFRYLRLTMTGTDTNGLYYLVISEIEFYGDLYRT